MKNNNLPINKDQILPRRLLLLGDVRKSWKNLGTGIGECRCSYDVAGGPESCPD
jgi:hypothetical protein